jgi:hypothetical protein
LGPWIRNRDLRRPKIIENTATEKDKKEGQDVFSG